MRVANMVPDMQYAMQQSQQALSPHCSRCQPACGSTSPPMILRPRRTWWSRSQLRQNVDQYTSNISSVLPQMQTADSAISSMVTSLNTAITLGTSGATGTASASNKQDIAAQVEGVLSSVVAQANTSYQGVYVFGGTASTNRPSWPPPQHYTSAQGSAGSPLAATTALTAGSITTISDATTGDTIDIQGGSGRYRRQLCRRRSPMRWRQGRYLPAPARPSMHPANWRSEPTPVPPVSWSASNDAALGSMTADSGVPSCECIRLRRRQHREHRAGGKIR
jgi:hypothetical protein